MFENFGSHLATHGHCFLSDEKRTFSIPSEHLNLGVYFKSHVSSGGSYGGAFRQVCVCLTNNFDVITGRFSQLLVLSPTQNNMVETRNSSDSSSDELELPEGTHSGSMTDQMDNNEQFADETDSVEVVTQDEIPEANLDCLKVCLPLCLHNRENGGNKRIKQVCCAICRHIFHQDCIGEIVNEKHFWTCVICRKLATTVRDLKSSVKELCSQNDTLIQLLKKQQLQLDAMQQQQHGLCTSLTTVASDVRRITCSLDIDEDDESSGDDDDIVAAGTLIVGDSMIRDVTSNCEHLTCESMSGARLCDIKKHLKTINPRKQRLEKILIVCGTNDCATRKTSENIVQEFEQVIRTAKERANEVVVSSILPRLDDKIEPNRIDTINQLLMTHCNSLEVNFINNDTNFKFQNGSVDEVLLLSGDRLHLSRQGITRLLQNLALTDLTKVTLKNGDAPKPHPPPYASAWAKPLATPKTPTPPQVAKPVARDNGLLKFKGPKSSFSNFFLTPIHAWNKTFTSVEHGYVYYKAIAMKKPHLTDGILAAATAKDAKDIGDSIRTNQQWTDMKTGVMYHLLEQKIRQCSKFANDLRASGNKVIIEDTGNVFWGRGPNGEGQNNLGRLLMTLRENQSSYKSQNSHSYEPLKIPNPPPSPLMHSRRSDFSYTPRPRVTPYRQHQGRNYPRNTHEQQHCFNCGEKSHNVRSCRHPQPLQCYSCLGKGHKQKFCPLSNVVRNDTF